ncbi:EAL domain-containing protein [Sphingomonas sp. SRS2]|uniref:EAL domain-containing protein n=1 Tax=Sphingomonas sp. SRS2 TaxID=133190 RepID=UPI0009FDD0E4|nr:EAL domain-containing protein [Sphingomonas sp. SRS2]
MPKAAYPIDEAARLDALLELGVLDTPPEPEFDALVKAAALICEVPISLVSLVDEKRQWFKANVGLPGVAETPRDFAFCAHSILGNDLLETSDATLDPRFSDNPLVTGNPDIRFYAGVPLRLSGGSHVGTLCVIDRQPRQLNDIQREVLRNLANATVKALEGRLAVRKLHDAVKIINARESSLRLIVDNAPSMMAYWNLDLTCRFANRVYERWFGVEASGLVGTNIRDLLGPELFALNKPHIDGVLAGNEQIFERAIPGPDGIIRHGLTYYSPDIIDGEVRGFLVQVSDVSALKKAQASLEEAQRLGGIGSWEWLPESDVTTWSEQLYHIMGRDPADGSPSFADHAQLYTAESWARLQTAVETALQSGQSYILEMEFVTPDGLTGWVEARGEVFRDEAQHVAKLRGTVQDITLRRALTAQLAAQHELLRVTLESIGDAVITTDERGIITWLNPVAAQMTGWDSVDAQGRPLSQVFHIISEETRRLAENPIEVALRQGRIVGLANHTMLISRNGHEFSIEDSAAPIRSETGDMMGAVLVFHDVTEQRRLSNEMSHRARHDGLTGLLNRTEFEIRLQRALTEAQTGGSAHALMYIDLDQFKIVNDTCGHTAGDMLLQQITKLLRDTVRSGDTIARLGGDEFAVLLEHCSRHDAERVAQQICDRLDDFRFIHDGKRFRIGASIGLVPIDSHWPTSTAIMQAADSSCYAAKEAGRNRVHIWFEADHMMHARQGETQWATRLEAALDEGRFRLFAQRILPVNDTGHGLYLEVLLRLVENDGMVILPGLFLPAAERFHLASRIDRSVIRQVADLLAGQPDLSAVDTICINLSGQSIGDRAFHREAISILSAAGTSVCECICLEITETAAITNIADAGAFIEQMHRLGVRIALDDFGAGAASFGYLKSLAIDVLKIDGQFVRDMISDPLDEAAVRCFVDVGRVLGIKIVAEGVEKQAVFSRLKLMGADYAQGYLFHRPEPIEDIIHCARAGDGERDSSIAAEVIAGRGPVLGTEMFCPDCP